MEEFLDEDHFVRFEKLLAVSLDFDKMPDEYIIASRINDDLKAIEKEKEKIEDKVQEIAGKIAEKLGLDLDKSIKLDW